REVIEDPEVETVSITAPNFMHREMALAAAKARKHFWGEKPLGRFPAETAEIAAAAGHAGIRTIVGLNYRHPPAVQHARRLIADGALGEITHFRMQFVASYSSNPKGALSWRFTRELAGLGILADLGSHAVDLALCLRGERNPGCGVVGLRADERAPGLLAAPERRQRLRAGADGAGPSRVRPLPAGAGDPDGLRRPEGDRSPSLPRIDRRRRAAG